MKRLIPRPLKSKVRSILSSAGRCLEHLPKNAQIFAAPNKQVFFGYYDVTPFNQSGTRLLACHAPLENVSPHQKHPPLQLGYYDLTEAAPAFHRFAETLTWNWQQGCRLQWLDDTRVMYNTLIDGTYGAIIQNIRSGTIEQSFTEALYSLDTTNKNFLSLDFAGLHEYRHGYGYNNLVSPRRHDSIILVNMRDGSTKPLFTLKDAWSFAPHADMKGALHYFNHLSYSPGGTRFMVTHLWVTPQGKRRTRILILTPGSDTILCPDNSGRTSHYAWLDDDRALIFHAVRGQGGQYILYNLLNGQQEIIAGKIFNEDGHPSITEKILLTDTYPDLFGRQHLAVYNRATHTARTLARLHTPPAFTGELRCDLHPRLDRTTGKVSIDAIRDGRRAMILLQLDPEDR